jgi:hypothetical protein
MTAHKYSGIRGYHLGKIGHQAAVLIRPLAAACVWLRSRWRSGSIDFEMSGDGCGNGVQVCLV